MTTETRNGKVAGMAGLPWFKCASNVAGHPKVSILAHELGVPDALGVLVRAWCWAALYAPDGRVSKRMAKAFGEYASGGIAVHGQAAIDALVSAGLLEENDLGYELHDWAEMQAAHVDKLARDRERSRVARAGGSSDRDGRATIQPTNAGESRDGRETVAGKREREIESERERESENARARGNADRDQIRDSVDGLESLPNTLAVLRALHAAGKASAGPARSPATRRRDEELIAAVGAAQAAERVLAAWDPSHPTLGWYASAISPPKRDDGKGMAPVGTDWTEVPTWMQGRKP